MLFAPPGHHMFIRGVAQLGSASALGAEGRWFESSRPDHGIIRARGHMPLAFL